MLLLDMSIKQYPVNPGFFNQSRNACKTEFSQHATFGPDISGIAMNTQYGPGPQLPAAWSVDFQQDFPLANGMLPHTDLPMSLFGYDAGGALPPSHIPMPTLTPDAFPRASSSQGLMPCLDANGNAPEIGIHPETYINGVNEWHHEQSCLVSARTYPTPDEACGHIIPSAPLSMVPGGSAFEPPQPQTRQNCFWDCGNNGYMMGNLSSQSYQTDGFSVEDPALQPAKDNPVSISPHSSSELFSMGRRHVSARGNDASPIDKTVSLSPPTSQPMKRSDIILNFAGARWSASDAQRRLPDMRTTELENKKKMTKIRPNLFSTSTFEAAASSSFTHQKRSKVRLQASIPDQRPKGPKAFCGYCDEQPEGFRGGHELTRHHSSKHNMIVKKFACRDPASVGLSSAVSVLQPLSECKACATGKLYGTDYNAAAHLRRTHFKPKARRGSNRKPDDEKRGGHGGGSWPSMSDLKLWMVEILVSGGGRGTDGEI